MARAYHALDWRGGKVRLWGMPPPPPEPKPAFLRFSARDVKFFLSSPAVVLVLLALASVPGLLGQLLQKEQPLPLQQPSAEQRWTAGTGNVASLALTAVHGALPAPDPRQRKPPCALDMGEEELGGVCWIRLDVAPPCPSGKAWERNGKCYARVLEVKAMPRDPTSGESRPLGVADP